MPNGMICAVFGDLGSTCMMVVVVLICSVCIIGGGVSFSVLLAVGMLEAAV